MADDKALKPRSYRINDETAEKIKEIAASIGGNQQETLAKLIEAYEFQSGKAVLTEKKSDIEQFEKYVNAIIRMYMGSLEDNQNITETVRTEFDALLQSKDAVIQDLQSRLVFANQSKEEAVSKAKVYEDENKALSGNIEKLQKEYTQKTNDLQSMLLDKESLNKALTDSCNELKLKLDQMKQEHDENIALKERIAELIQERDKALKQVEYGEEAISSLREKLQLEHEKSILELERKYHEEKQAEVDKYQKKYFELLENMNAPKGEQSTYCEVKQTGLRNEMAVFKN